MAPYSAEAPIVATLDSGDEPSPLEPMIAPSNPRPRKMPAPLPGSVPRFPQLSTQSAHPTVLVPAPQPTNGQYKLSIPKAEDYPPFPTTHNSSSSSDARITNGTATGDGYVPVFNAAILGGETDDFKISQAGKRRKISIPVTTPGNTESLEPIRRKEAPAQKFYGVKVGHVPGVYTDWKLVESQIKGCKGALQLRFDTREEAQAFVDGKFSPPQDRYEPFANGGAEQPPVGSPTTTSMIGSGHFNGKQSALVSYPTAPSQPVAAPHTIPTAHLNTNGLPSVQSLNMILKTNGVGKSFAGSKERSHSRREMHLGRFDNTPSSSGAAKPALNGLAIVKNSAHEMVVDRDHGMPSQQLTLGRPPVDGNLSSSGNLLEPRNDSSQENGSAVEDPFGILLEDEVYLELLSQAPANDKVALLLNASSRGQAMARNVRMPHAQNSTNRESPGRASVLNESPPAAARSYRDSAFSNSDTPNVSATIPRNQSTSGFPVAHSVVATVEQPSARPKWTGGLSEKEAHLLIFLKEVKKYKWTEITAKFQEHFPERSYGILQTNYSQKINRRDRTRDPPTLMLPSCYASEAQIDWVEVHANPSRSNDHSRQRKRKLDIIQERPQHRDQSGAVPIWPATVGSAQDQLSGAELSSHHRRPRRAVPVKNYAWPKRNAQTVEDLFDEDDYTMVDLLEEKLVGSETGKDLAPALEKAIPIDNEPIPVEFDQDDATLALVTQTRNTAANVQHLPYLSSSQRSSLQDAPCGFEWDQLVSRDWQGTLIHVDFSPPELDIVEGTITRLVKPSRALRPHSQRKRFQRFLSGLAEPDLLRLTNALRSKLLSRDRRSIDAFLQDAKDNKIRSTAPRIERLAAARPNKSFSSDANLSVSSMIRRRETGIQSHRGWNSAAKPLSYQLKNKVQDSLGPVCSYTGASSDVHAVAWSVDGQCFAAGAICVDDPHSMQYNRPNNLLYGDVSRNTINELGKHHVMRPKPESGPNSTHAMYASQDPKLYKTVTSVAFCPSGKFMFSGGWDQNVAVWETKYDGSQPTEIVSLHHKAEVNMMTVNSLGVLATATKKPTGNAVKVIHISEDDPLKPPVIANFSSLKAAKRPDMSILPTALHFSPRYENLLLGGFGAHVRQDGRDMSGDICLWDINGNQALDIWGSGKNVFDLSFHPRQRWFAVGTVAGQNTNRGTRSTVRLYDEQTTGMHNKFSMRVELECRALDINDVVWCPGDDFLVAAGCTSGRAYVWDVRNPHHFLRELAHGSSLMPLDEGIDRELTDTGVRFLAWGENATRLYTGSSDGVVKVWNVARSEEQTFVKDLVTLDSGIMSGAFSPDRSRLLLGEVNGSVNVLEVGRDDCSFKDAEKMRFIPYKGCDGGANTDRDATQSTTADVEPGIASAKELLETGQMITMPMGGLPIRQAVQGPAYAGPFDLGVDAPFLREQALEMQLKLAEPPVSQCSIPKCQEAVPKITSEETGDSGRSADRIPDALRLEWERARNDLISISGKTQCSNCGRIARPSTSPDEVYCERCAFSCFRCGAINQIAPSTETFECHLCKCTWDVGALGYDCTGGIHTWDDSVDVLHLSGIPRLDRYKQSLSEAKKEATSPLGDYDTTFGDEMNALTDHYFSLAIDRPESPSL